MNTQIESYGIDRDANELIKVVYCNKHLPAGWTATEFSRREVEAPCEICAFEWNSKVMNFIQLNPCLQNLDFASLTYISGPMTGIKDHNKPAFFVAEAAFKRQGYKILSPAHWPEGQEYAWYMEQDIKMILECTQIFCLKGWRQSRGSVVEVEVGKALNKHIIEEL